MWSLYYLDGQFVPHDPRVTQEGMLALEDVEIGSADTYPPRSHESVAGLFERHFARFKNEPARFGAYERLN